MRNRVSIVKEDRIWQLRCQGYGYESIGAIVNCKPSYMTVILRRVRNRPPLEEDPIRRGRRRNFLSDDQITEIKQRKARGETLLSIAKDFALTESAIWHITSGRTYKEPAGDAGYEYNFNNRLMK